MTVALKKFKTPAERCADGGLTRATLSHRRLLILPSFYRLLLLLLQLLLLLLHSLLFLASPPPSPFVAEAVQAAEAGAGEGHWPT